MKTVVWAGAIPFACSTGAICRVSLGFEIDETRPGKVPVMTVDILDFGHDKWTWKLLPRSDDRCMMAESLAIARLAHRAGVAVDEGSCEYCRMREWHMAGGRTLCERCGQLASQIDANFAIARSGGGTSEEHASPAKVSGSTMAWQAVVDQAVLVGLAWREACRAGDDKVVPWYISKSLDSLAYDVQCRIDGQRFCERFEDGQEINGTTGCLTNRGAK